VVSRAFRTLSAVLNQGRSRWLLLLAFLTIALFFFAASVAVLYRSREIQRTTPAILNNALESVELVSRMGVDTSRMRQLVGTHILENNLARKLRIEGEIAQTENDFANAAASYDSLAMFAGERNAWRHLEKNVEEIQGPIGRVLKLSRDNQAATARGAFYALEDQFADVSHDVDDLIRINRNAAETQALRVQTLQRSVSSFHTLLMLLGIGSTFVVGWWTIYLIGNRELQLMRYSAMLEMRNRDLDAFAGRVAHDLRGPLSNISLAASRLAQENIREPGTISILQRGVKRMNTLIEDLLALSSIGAEPSGICDPAVAASQVQQDLSSRLESERGSMQVDVVPASVRGVEGLLRQALWNLAENAIKYRRPEAPVHIAIDGRPASRSRYELRVSDNGAGMSAEESQKAFDPFYRAMLARRMPGTGHSQLGQGTTFTIILPLVDRDA
jgi:signal transduction histidine kinase